MSLGKENEQIRRYLRMCTHSGNATYLMFIFRPLIAWTLRERAVVLHKIFLPLTYMQMLVSELQRTE